MKRFVAVMLLALLPLAAIQTVQCYRESREGVNAIRGSSNTAMSKILSAFEAEPGLALPKSTERLCVLFVTESGIDASLYIRVDFTDPSELSTIGWMKGATDLNEPVWALIGPPDAYGVKWWVAAQGRDARCVQVNALSSRAEACVVRGRDHISVFLVYLSDLKTYSPGFLSLMESFPAYVRSWFPLRGAPHGGCWTRGDG